MLKGTDSRLVVVGDNEAVRTGLVGVVQRAGHICVGEAESLEDAVRIVACSRPDVALIDKRLRDDYDIQGCRQIREVSPCTRIIMLTSYLNDHEFVRSLLAGASACLLKQVRGGSELALAIDSVRRGENRISEQLAPYLSRVTHPDHSPLTESERSVLSLIAGLKTDSEIAASLDVSVHNVPSMVRHLAEKLIAVP